MERVSRPSVDAQGELRVFSVLSDLLLAVALAVLAPLERVLELGLPLRALHWPLVLLVDVYLLLHTEHSYIALRPEHHGAGLRLACVNRWEQVHVVDLLRT